MAQHAQDDGFHEIQLNGKQLVFVFMAATVVSVVIFLCGVLVGRGVRAERADPVQASAQPAVDQLNDAITPEKPPTVQASDDPTRALPPSPAEGGSSTVEPGSAPLAAAGGAVDAAGAAALAAAARAADTAAAKVATPAPAATTTRSRAADRPGETASAPEGKGAATPAASASARAAAAAAGKPAATAKAAATTPARVADPVTPARSAEPAKGAPAPAIPAADAKGQGWVVQVAARKTRAEADTIARRLNSKGFPAFVLSNANMFRVRVGGYNSRKDADSVAAKLKREERVNPWVTR